MRLQHIHHWSIRNCFCHNSWYNNDWECHHVITCLLFWPYSGIFFDEKSWSRWGSNSRPLAWEADVLTTRPPGLRLLAFHFGDRQNRTKASTEYLIDFDMDAALGKICNKWRLDYSSQKMLAWWKLLETPTSLLCSSIFLSQIVAEQLSNV